MFGLKDQMLLWVSGLLLVALLAGGSYHFILTAALEHELKSKSVMVADLTQENVTLTTANLQLSRSLETQTQKIRELVTASSAASEAADVAIAKAQAESRKWRGKYQDLWNAPRPTGDDCKDLSLKIDQYIELRKAEVTP